MANGADPDHDVCVELLRSATAPLIVPGPVLAELTYLVGRTLGAHAEASVLRSLSAARYQIEPLLPTDLARMGDLVEQYADLPLGGTDAAAIAIAERLQLDTVATLDRRHFSVVRPSHMGALTLIP